MSRDIRYRFLGRVSIPQWFDYNYYIANCSQVDHIVSIPQWFDYNLDLTITETTHTASLNSTMVRLQPYELTLSKIHIYIKSQFHNGSITTTVKMKGLKPNGDCLNSTMVRLQQKKRR